MHDASVALTLIILRGEVILAGVALILIVAWLVLKLARRPKPDPKLALVLSLVEGLPKELRPDEASSETQEEMSVHQEHGPMGPGGFTLSA